MGIGQLIQEKERDGAFACNGNERRCHPNNAEIKSHKCSENVLTVNYYDFLSAIFLEKSHMSSFVLCMSQTGSLANAAALELDDVIQDLESK